ncbi:MAG: MMPL family transporter [Clostridiales bacterium]|nr:MMPL family transporter [Clostridiales bacterium]
MKEGLSLKLARFIIEKRARIEKLFLAGCLFSLVAMNLVRVNYDLTNYIPADAPFSVGLAVMESEFGYPGTGRVMLEDVTLYEAKQYKDRMEAVDGVDSITWCDSLVNLYAGEDFIRMDDIADYYKDGCAVMDITFDEESDSERTKQAISELQAIAGEKGSFVGMAVQNKSLIETSASEMGRILVVAVIMLYVVLTFMTTAWTEPLLFMVVMGVAVLLNRGTNVFVGTISFLTNNVAIILQLATSMDYSIFLLDAFMRWRDSGLPDEEAIVRAVDDAINSIFASSLTTVVGFLALVTMKFHIGFDMGLVLAKGIFFSLLSEVFFMPAMILVFTAWNDRTKHRSFFPDFMPFAGFVYRIRYVVLAAVILITPPAYIAQGMNHFLYGNDAVGASVGTQVYEDDREITARFGRSNMLLLIYPDTGDVTEKRMSEELTSLDYVKSVTSLANALPDGVPKEFLPESTVEQLHSGGWCRTLLYIRTKSESETAFACVDEIREIMKKYYPEDSYVVGETAATEDIREIITEDNTRVNRLSLLGVFLVILASFRSVLIPFVVMIPIEAAIFINMALPYIQGLDMDYMGYIIVSSIQLGATVDYAILLTNHYMAKRRLLPKKQACIEAIALSCPSVFTSGTIITVAGYIVYHISTTAAIGDLGHLIGRGGMFSLILVLTLLPALLVIFDAWIVEKKQRRALREMGRRWKNRRMKIWKRFRRGRLRRMTAGVLAVLMTLSGVGAAGPVYGAEASVDVDEAMYVNLDLYGRMDKVNVVKSCDRNGVRSFTDYGDYTDVANMTDDTEPVRGDGFVTWNLPDDAQPRFYYRCELAPEAVTLPWNFDVSYRLNGVPKNGEELAGASGLVEIQIKATANEDALEYYRNNMILAVAVLIDLDECYSVDADGAQVQNLGSQTGVVFTALPGEDGDYTVRIGTDCFETDGIYMAMIPGTTEELEHITDLKEAKDTWKDAGDELYDSMEGMARSIESMRDGVLRMQDGLASAEEAREVWSAAKDPILDENERTLASLSAVSGQLSAMIPHIQTAKEAAETLDDSLDDIVRTMGEMQDPLRDLSRELYGIQSNSDDVAAALPRVTSLMQELVALNARLDASTQVYVTQLALVSSSLSDAEEDEEAEEELIDDVTPVATDGDATAVGLSRRGTTMTGHAAMAGLSRHETPLVGVGVSGVTLDAASLLSTLTQKSEVLKDFADASNTLSKEMQKLLADTADAARYTADLAEMLDCLIADVEITQESLKIYYPDLQRALDDSEELVRLTTDALDQSVGTAALVQEALRDSSGSLDAAARESILAAMELLDQSLCVLDATASMRESGRTMKDVLDSEWDDLEQETRFLYMDPNARKVSFTSEQNGEPKSLQIILRTAEIRVDEGEELLDAEAAEQESGPLARRRSVLQRLWEWSTGIFWE